MKGLRPAACVAALALAAVPAYPTPAYAQDTQHEWVLLNTPRAQVQAIHHASQHPGRVLVTLARGEDAPPAHVGAWLSEDGAYSWAPAVADSLHVFPGTPSTLSADGTAYLLTSLTLHWLPAGETEWQQRQLGWIDGPLSGTHHLATGLQLDAPVWAAVNGPPMELRRLFRFDPVTRTGQQLRLPDQPTARFVHALAVDRQNPDRILLATSLEAQPSANFPIRLWMTSNNAATWTAQSTTGLPPVGITGLALDGGRMHASFAGDTDGLYRLAAQGQPWQRILPVDGSSLEVNGFTFSPTDGELVAAATAEGVFASDDDGASWHRVEGEGIHALPAHSVQATVEGGLLAGIADQGVFRTGAGDEGLVPAGGHLNPPPVRSIAHRPDAPASMALIEQGSPLMSRPRLLESGDGGASWSAVEIGAEVSVLRSLAFGPQDTMWVVGRPVTGTPEALYRRGADASWSTRTPVAGWLSPREIARVLPLADRPGHVLATSASSYDGGGSQPPEKRLWASVDDGDHWTMPLSVPGSHTTDLLDDLGDALDDRLLLVINNGAGAFRAFRSGGVSGPWSEIAASGLAGQMRFATRGCVAGAAVGQPRAYLFGQHDWNYQLRLFASDDAGESWQSSGWTGSLNLGQPRAIACDPVNPDGVWLGTSNGVILASEDGGASFQNLAGGSPQPGDVTGLLASPLGLYTATELGAFAWIESEAVEPGLSVTNIGTRMRQTLEVQWWDGLPEMVLLRDGTPITAGGASGSYQLRVSIPELPTTLQVCSPDLATCSEPVTHQR